MKHMSDVRCGDAAKGGESRGPMPGSPMRGSGPHARLSLRHEGMKAWKSAI